MSATVAKTRLDELAERANGKNREVYLSAMTMLYAGMDAGDALLEVKATLPRGEFRSWCADNIEFSYSSASDYMRVATNRAEIEAADALDEVNTMQKAISFLKANKLTAQSRIDDAMVERIKDLVPKIGVHATARELGVAYGTAHRYAAGYEKQRRITAPSVRPTEELIGALFPDDLIRINTVAKTITTPTQAAFDHTLSRRNDPEKYEHLAALAIATARKMRAQRAYREANPDA